MQIFASNVEERVHLQVSQQIKRMIAKSRMRPGDSLPNYDELCGKFNVSPVTLKKALDELYKEKLIFSRRGKGLFVNRTIAAQRKLSLIGLVYSYSHQTFFSSTYLMEIFQGIMLEADIAAAGVRAFSIKATQKRESRLVSPEELEEAGVDGAILIAVHNRDFIARFAGRDFAISVVDNLEAGIPADFIVVDNKTATQRAVDHLRRLGHKRIAYLDGWTTDDVLGDAKLNPVVDSSDIIERREAYQSAMRTIGASEVVLQNKPSGLEGSDIKAISLAAAQLLKLSDRPTAVVAYGVETASHLMHELRARNVRVPEDISITAVAAASNLPGELSGIAVNRVNFVEMGRQAVRILQQRCSGARPKETQIVRIGSEYFEGQTVAQANA